MTVDGRSYSYILDPEASDSTISDTFYQLFAAAPEGKEILIIMGYTGYGEMYGYTYWQDTGTNQPTGVFTANGGDVGVTAASATAITVDEIIALIYALKSPCRRNAKFLMNDATVALIRKLKDNNGAYLWQPSVQAGQPDKLLGYEIYTSPYVPTVKAGALAIAFGDFHNYWMRAIGQITIINLNDVIASDTPPENPYFGQLWVNTAVVPPETMVWDGQGWVVQNNLEELRTTVSTHTTRFGEFQSSVDGLNSYVSSVTETVERLEGSISGEQEKVLELTPSPPRIFPSLVGLFFIGKSKIIGVG